MAARYYKYITAVGRPVHYAGCDEVEDGNEGWAVCIDGLDAAVHARVQLHLQL